MAFDPQKVIAIAKAEEGYLEKKSNENLDSKTANAGSKNYTKYARDLDALGFYNGKKNGVAWCDIFVDWCFFKAYGLENAQKLTFQKIGKSNSGAGCKYSRNYYKINGRLFDTPQAGDQIFFYGTDKTSISHTGLVVKVDSTYVYTVEGNTSSESGVVANGGCVREKKYKLNHNRIAGYGRPNYGITASANDPDWTDTPGDTPPGKDTNVPANGANTVTVADGTYFLRRGPGKEYAHDGIYVVEGERLEKVEPGTWTAVKYKNKDGEIETRWIGASGVAE